MGRGSVYWTPPQAGRPGEIAFRAASANPFEGTAFAGFFAGWRRLESRTRHA